MVNIYIAMGNMHSTLFNFVIRKVILYAPNQTHIYKQQTCHCSILELSIEIQYNSA